ncbi:hypothetical protein FHR83_006785 [Actinoplanes campanulatus]|uniref:Uncharacterized protein n=1 Tax=Actinoplanes campanulatus TaxID=113559 RepID=A0A7W5ANH8_9ACTN|nr:hypothetical protein [Actinoplanes campanulatus]MBB3099079.1 hypothetical protein [Actinoplanes campanulatus]GGN39137.1 hypothetical protein GCM10010109_66730 [Actinoplanes campanulatus]GID40236.1 hypothetical protein Aca09nite_67420 [Actinoplanes campanulatus]
MPTVLIRWHTPSALTIYADGKPIGSASDDSDFPDEPPLSTPLVAAVVAEDVARALGADVKVQRP